jgi:hypothetical protein
MVVVVVALRLALRNGGGGVCEGVYISDGGVLVVDAR